MIRVETLLRSEIGLDAATLGPNTVARAAQSRMKSLGIKSADDYLRLLHSAPAERTELVEAVVVTETWFYRDRDAFAAFTQLARDWLAANPTAKLRVLSVPCSTGEEPFTLAMCLLDAGVPPPRFTIDAVDISARSLARAATGLYGRNSFRGDDLAFRSRHFTHGKGGYTLHQRVRDCVRFQQDNLLNGHFLQDREPYPFIFCRNVLIYFDRETQSKVIRTLAAKLAADGLLFVGPAEVPVLLDNGFSTAEIPKAFACRVGSPKAKVKTPPPVETSPQPAVHSPPSEIVAPPTGDSGLKTVDLQKLDSARQLADAGKLDEAAALCEAHLHDAGPSAEAFYLLGLVRDARGVPDAADFYRKAIYLDPGHSDALWHLALLLEKSGDHDEARSLKRRAQNVQKPTAKK